MARKSSRRIKVGREVAAGEGIIARLADRAIDNPAMSGGLVVMALTASAIVSNAMFLQAGRHPEPLFATRPASVPTPREAVPRPIPVPESTVPLPRSRADSVGEPQPQPPAAVGVTTDPAPDGKLVSDIQRELARLGLYADAIDGIAGSRTRTAISAYEAAAGLPVTGETSAALLEALRTPAESTAAPSEAVRPAETDLLEPVIQRSTEPAAAADEATDLAAAQKQRAEVEEQARYFRVQAALNLIGYGPITVDGKGGEQTANAIRRFELDHGLPITGTVNDRLIERLVAIGAMQSM